MRVFAAEGGGRWRGTPVTTSLGSTTSRPLRVPEACFSVVWRERKARRAMSSAFALWEWRTALVADCSLGPTASQRQRGERAVPARGFLRARRLARAAEPSIMRSTTVAATSSQRVAEPVQCRFGQRSARAPTHQCYRARLVYAIVERASARSGAAPSRVDMVRRRGASTQSSMRSASH